MPDTKDLEEIPPNNMFVCEYDGQRTIVPGRDVQLWNDGLDGDLEPVRDLGTIVHSWQVTGSGNESIVRADQYLTEADYLITASAEPQATESRIESDVDVSVEIPTTLFQPQHVAAASKSADTTPFDDSPAAIATAINENVADELRTRYEAWRMQQSPYPRGRDHGYDIPLHTDWKRRVLTEQTSLSDSEVNVLVDFGYPFSMRVDVRVE